MRIKEWRDAIIEAAIIIILLFLFCWPVKINGISMEHTFYDKNRVYISRISKYINDIETGDIIVFSETLNGEKKELIKRVIAKEGDTVKIDRGKVYVNSEEITEDYTTGMTMGHIEITVPENSFFVLGDNREDSIDSRHLGTISKNDIIGKVIFKIYPFDEIQLY